MRCRNGFSLIEVLIAIGILSSITMVLAQSFYTTTRGSAKSELQTTIKQSGDFSIRAVEQLFRASESVSSSCTGASLSSVSVTDARGNETIFGCVYDAVSEVTRIASTSANVAQYLTPETVTLGGINCSDPGMTLRFRCTQNAGASPSIQINFSLAQSGLPLDQFNRAQMSFQTSVNMRSY